MEALLISACLFGSNCKYTGGNNYLGEDTLLRLKEKYLLIPVCPEVAGGLPVPRIPSEIRDRSVYSKQGIDVTAEFKCGAGFALELCKRYNCRKALLKEKSPSCGNGKIYDGTFTGTITDGHGVTAELLKDNSVLIFGESDIDKLL